MDVQIPENIRMLFAPISIPLSRFSANRITVKKIVCPIFLFDFDMKIAAYTPLQNTDTTKNNLSCRYKPMIPKG